MAMPRVTQHCAMMMMTERREARSEVGNKQMVFSENNTKNPQYFRLTDLSRHPKIQAYNTRYYSYRYHFLVLVVLVLVEGSGGGTN
jgi:hypothetical protein